MADIPEVEVLRGQLGKDVVGRKIKAVAATSGKVVRPHKDVKTFRALSEGRVIKTVSRLGRDLILGLDNGHALVLALGTDGQLERPKSAKDAKTKHTAVVMTFTQGPDLRVVDPKGTVQLFVAEPTPEGEKAVINIIPERLSIGGDGLTLRKTWPALGALGLDFLEDQFGWDRMASVCKYKKMPLKQLMMDESVFVGLGSDYLDDALFAAGLRFDRASEGVSTIESRRLHRALFELLTEAIKTGGSVPFVDLEGKAGTFQTQFQVVGREGQPCPTCRYELEHRTSDGVSSTLCSRCQA